MKLQHHFETTSGLRLAYWSWGRPDEPAIVALHDLCDVGYSFALVAEQLEQGALVVAPDLRGHGNSDHAPGGGYTSVANYLADVWQLLCHLEISRCTFLGHGYGALLAWFCATLFPELAVGAVLLDPLAANISAAAHLSHLKQWIENTTDQRGREVASVAATAQQLFVPHSPLSDEQKRLLARHRLCPHPDGTLRWCHDPLVEGLPPRIDPQLVQHIVENLRCPLLVIQSGSGPSPFSSLLPTGTTTHVVDAVVQSAHLELPAEVAALVRQQMPGWGVE